MPIKIHPIACGLLGYYNQLFHALGSKIPRFLQKALHRYAPVTAAYFGNNTVGTVFVTALCYFQISKMSACGHHAVHPGKGFSVQSLIMILLYPAQNIIQRLYHFINSRSTYDGIHFFDFFLNFFPVTLGQTPCHNQRFNIPVLSKFCHLQNRINTLLLGVIYETAGIDDNCLRLPFIVGKGITALAQKSQHLFRIHQILVTSQGDE